MASGVFRSDAADGRPRALRARLRRLWKRCLALQLAQAMPLHQRKPRISRLFVESRSPRDRSTLESPRLARAVRCDFCLVALLRLVCL